MKKKKRKKERKNVERKSTGEEEGERVGVGSFSGKKIKKDSENSFTCFALFIYLFVSLSYHYLFLSLHYYKTKQASHTYLFCMSLKTVDSLFHALSMSAYNTRLFLFTSLFF